MLPSKTVMNIMLNIWRQFEAVSFDLTDGSNPYGVYFEMQISARESGFIWKCQWGFIMLRNLTFWLI